MCKRLPDLPGFFVVKNPVQYGLHTKWCRGHSAVTGAHDHNNVIFQERFLRVTSHSRVVVNRRMKTEKYSILAISCPKPVFRVSSVRAACVLMTIVLHSISCAFVYAQYMYRRNKSSHC